MAIARVVSFEGVSQERMDEMRERMNDGEQPEGLDATELLILHDPESEKSIAIVFFETDEAYRRGHEILDSMPTPDTPGRRTSVQRYEVAHRMTS